MYNISDFRARYGTSPERIDYQTLTGVESIFLPVVLSETTHSIVVEGTVIIGEGGATKKVRIAVDDLVKVWERPQVTEFKKVTL